MPRRTGASIAFNAPAPHDKTNDMIYSFTLDGDTTTDGSFAPIGVDPVVAAHPGSIANKTAITVNEPGTLTTLYLKGNTNAASIEDRWTVEKNGSNTAITCNSAIGANFAQNLVNSVSLAKGDIFSIRQESNVANFGQISGSLLFTPA